MFIVNKLNDTLSMEFNKNVHILDKTIEMIKIFFDLDDYVKAFCVFYYAGIGSMMGLCPYDPEQGLENFSPGEIDLNDIYIEQDILYFSYRVNDELRIQKLCDSKSAAYHQMLWQAYCNDSKTADWWLRYDMFLTNKRVIEQEKLINELTTRVEMFEGMFKDLNQRIKE